LVKRLKVLIMGAAGRDFHNFNTFYRDNESYEVIAFTAAQIPNISSRRYPPELSGKLYPKGIPIYPEENLVQLVKERDIDQVVFAYSDVDHEYVMHKASIAIAAGADFVLLGSESTMLDSIKPVIAVCAVRTGSGKSPTTRRICNILVARGKKVVVVRHPMPYGELRKQAVQRFVKHEDFEHHECTIEEREEFEPLIDLGITVYAGVDCKAILHKAELEAEIIVWDGGNNDLPFIRPQLHIVVSDARRPGHEVCFHPGEANFRMADVIIINKIENVQDKSVQTIIKNKSYANPSARTIYARMKQFVDKPHLLKEKARALIVEDGPTLTHGGLSTGAAYIVAEKYGCEVVDPRPFAVGSIRNVYDNYSHLSKVLPAMGYGSEQIRELEETINAINCDVVIIGTPVDLRRFMKIDKPAVRVRYEIEEFGQLSLEDVLNEWLKDTKI